jgi:serine/threonine protein kinase
MQPTPNQDAADAGKSTALADLIRQIQADAKAGKEIDRAAILKAHPQLASQLEQELEKLERASHAGQASHVTSTFVSAETTAATKPSIQVPGYSVLSQIGCGGQAIVYLAIQLSTGRKRAVKVLRDGQFADAQATARFGREIATLAALNHPNIVPIIDTGQTADGHRFLVMDYIAGSTLDDLMKNRRIGEGEDPGKLLKLFLKICASVNVAHRSGIFHRDLKPSNILIDGRGEPHVLDFGLARSTLDRFIRGQSSQVSVTGEFLGSLPWCSPEQAEGDPDRIDIRTDVYSLGVILYQILTGGQFPYEVVGNIRDVLNNILTAVPKPPTKVLAAARARQSQVRRQVAPQNPPIVNEAIERIVLKALAKKPDDRYQTAGELGRDISNYLLGRPTPLAPAPMPVNARRNNWKYATGLAAFLAVTATLFFLHRHANAPTIAASPAQPPGAANLPVASPASSVIAAIPPESPNSSLAPANQRSVISVTNGTAHLEGADLALTPHDPGVPCGFLFGDLSWSDYQLTFKAIANSDEGYAVWFHWTGAPGCVVFSPAGPLLPQLWMRQGNRVDRVQNRRARIEPDTWHDIRVDAHGADFDCYVDGEQWFHEHDDRYTHGRIMLVTRSAAARFRDIRVTAADGSVLFSGPPDLSGLPASQRDSGAAANPTLLNRVDLLGALDLAKSTLSGYWNLKNSTLSSAQGARAQIEFPYTPGVQYDYRIQLTRSQGDAPISLIGVGGGHEFSWVIGGPRDTVCGLAKIGGKDFDDNPTTTRNRGLLLNGRTHTLVLAVRGQMVRAFIDGTQHCIYKTDFKDLTIDPTLAQPGKTTLGFCINGDSVTIQSADVLEIPESKTQQ